MERKPRAAPPTRALRSGQPHSRSEHPQDLAHPHLLVLKMDFSKDERDELRQAKLLLENPGLAAKLASYIGSPVEKGMKLLPKRWQNGVHSATEEALMKAPDVALKSLGARSEAQSVRTASNKFHRIAVATSGAVGGAFGIAALSIELPVSTTIILRSI